MYSVIRLLPLRLAAPGLRSTAQCRSSVSTGNAFASSRSFTTTIGAYAAVKAADKKTAAKKKTPAKKDSTKKPAAKKAAPKKKAKLVEVKATEEITPKSLFHNSLLKTIREQKFTKKLEVKEFVSSKWNELSKEDRAVWIRTARLKKHKEARKQLPKLLSPFVIFVRDLFHKYQQLRPDGKVLLILTLKKIAEEWKQLLEEEKEPIKKKWAQMSEAYHQKKKELEQPKKALGYNEFVKSAFETNESELALLSPSEKVTEIAKKWGGLLAAEKESWQAKAKEINERA